MLSQALTMRLSFTLISIWIIIGYSSSEIAVRKCASNWDVFSCEVAETPSLLWTTCSKRDTKWNFRNVATSLKQWILSITVVSTE